MAPQSAIHNPQSTISPTIFRAYDIRGIVDETLTPEIVRTLGLAIGSEAQARNQSKIIIARDGRLSGPTLSQALAQGILASGCDVIDIGMVPTPILYFATYHLNIPSGVMLTGSHNPANYNGLKIVLAGQTLSGEDIQNLYQRILAKDFYMGQGKIFSQTIIEDYINHIIRDVKLAKPLKIVIDCGNGITGKVAPELFKKLGCEVISLFAEVDGNFPNHHPDPSQTENLHDLIEAVTTYRADIGLAFDGDGDRLGVVTNTGEVIWPDRQLMLFATDILQRHPGEKIIFDVKCTRHLANVIAESGGIPLMWKTGHSFIKAKIRELAAPLAGEMSGHIFFRDRWFGFDDGLYAGVRLLEILAKNSLTSAEIFQQFPNSANTPELKLPIAEEHKFIFMEKFINEAKFHHGKINTIDGLRVDFDNGFGLLRPSNTSPYLILRFEADTELGLNQIQTLFREQLLRLDASLQLPF